MILVLLATLASTAFFLAQGTTNLVAASYLEIDRSVTTASNGPRAVAQRQKQDDTQILRRNIFDGVPLDGEPVVEGEELEVIEGAEPLVIDPSGPQPPCDGSMRLVAAVAHPLNEAWSVAAIVGAAGKALMYRPGQSIDEREVIEVRHHSVILRQAGSLCQIAMFAEEEVTASARPTVAITPTAPTRPARPEREGAISSDAMESGITRINDTTFNIQRSLVDSVLENQQALLSAARIIPHEENGRTVGVKMYGIRRNSLLGRLGVQNGDMLRTINGYDMSSPDSALEAYTRLRTADHLTLNVVRRGQPTTLDYNIQ
ncbi:MAG: general secretion pathway protein C [Polyangiales bacterium]|jgi:general secretion pathway protein C